MSSVFYERYLKTPYWLQLRERTLKRFRNRCAVCGTDKKLQVHHLTYQRAGQSVLYHEIDADLVVLCNPCHQAWHKVERIDRRYTDKMKSKIEGKVSTAVFKNAGSPKNRRKKKHKYRETRTGDQIIRDLYGLNSR